MKIGDVGEMGSPRISHAADGVPKETFVLSERLRELAERIDRGELDEPKQGIVLLLDGRTMTVCPLGSMQKMEIRDMANALIQTLDASDRVGVYER